MKKILVHAKQGHVVVASYKEENKVSVVTKTGKFLVGETDSTIPNAMEVLADVLERLSAGDDVAQVAIIGAVADKIIGTSTAYIDRTGNAQVKNYPNILVREFWEQKVLSNNRALSAPELETYARLIKAIGATYGQVIITSQQYVAKSLKPGMTAEQVEWTNLYLNAETVINGKTMPAPKVATPVTSAVDTYGDEGEEEVELEAL